MGVTMLLGAPGYGKSTMLAWYVKKALKKKKKVYSNVYIEGAYILNCQEDLNHYLIEDALIVVDEASAEWDNRSWKSFSEKVKRFFQMHRHYDLDVIISAQSYEDVDVKIKRLVTQVKICKKSLFYPWIVKTKSIRQDVDISEDNSAIIAVFQWKFWLWGNKYILAPLVWGLFDSYFRDLLNEKEWQTWTEENKEYYIKDYRIEENKKSDKQKQLAKGKAVVM